MQETLATPPPVIAHGDGLPAGSIDAAGRVAVHAPCVRCGYNLRAQPSSGVCPECETAVNVSLRPEFLSFAPPRATRMLVAGSAVLIMMGLLYGLTILANHFGGRFANALDVWWIRTQIAAELAVHVLLLVSAVLLTWRTSSRDTAGRTALRLSVRILMLLTLLTAAAWHALVYEVLTGATDWSLQGWFSYPYIVTDTVSYAFLVWYRRTLALRTASTTLSRWLLALFILTILIAVNDYAVWPIRIALFGLPPIAVSYAFYFVGLAVNLFDFILMIAQHRTLRRAHRRAKENWTILQQ